MKFSFTIQDTILTDQYSSYLKIKIPFFPFSRFFFSLHVQTDVHYVILGGDLRGVSPSGLEKILKCDWK